MLTMPLATCTWRVSASSRSKCGANPASKPPDDHSVAKPSVSSVGGDVDLRVVCDPPRTTPPHAQTTEVHRMDRSGIWTQAVGCVQARCKSRVAVPPR